MIKFSAFQPIYHCAMLSALSLWAFGNFPSEAYGQNAEDAPQGVSIERAALSLIAPEKFRVPLEVSPVRTLPVVSPMDGVVRDVFVKVGDSIQEQMEIIRLDSQVFAMELKRAQAVHEVAKIALAQATEPKAKQLLEAKLNVAKRELELAAFRSGQTILRTGLSGTVTELFVTPGQFVRAGDLLAKVVDPTQLYVQIPAERGSIEVGKTVPLTIEDQTADATVEAILPPLPEFNPLRELFVSVATARLVIDSKDGRFTPGQSVVSKMVPKFPVAEIQILALKTDTETPDSERMVQVIRDGFVRTIPVQVLGQVGQTHIFVSGRFSPNDELIISSSQSLEDGSWVRPMLLETNAPENPTRTPSPAPAPRTGF
ncbi:efflux RND transporter periplasmic adaptor subunit [Thalassoglobus polymorphus]|uniref:Acetyl-CoA carboxylase biotin carboxyl carrier protein subunit n=1 Tax=Thalassoglobus polymorphus TaxID=2527994 RepID=A0A517QNM7_9PLAN|nr:HlyD family efflux transporter periplasmic adaptor subunit [Thalassoglobus polymorphus]QDT33204.1 acetyl-CoA carboxylase biotin carboxyl carrier protein subunit [Thalassoglobus polymorphus]